MKNREPSLYPLLFEDLNLFPVIFITKEVNNLTLELKRVYIFPLLMWMRLPAIIPKSIESIMSRTVSFYETSTIKGRET